MVELLLAGDEDLIRGRGAVLTVCDPCCGSGGMLTITKEHITEGIRKNGDFLRPDAWIDTSKRDEKDGGVGIVGYEINFNRYFYRYAPPRPLKEIEADIQTIEKDIMRMLAEVTGGGRPE